MHTEAVALALQQRVSSKRSQHTIALDSVLQYRTQAVRQLVRLGLENSDWDVIRGQEGAPAE